MTVLHGLFGITILLATAAACSENFRAIPLRVVVAGVLTQIALALLLLKFPPAVSLILLVSRAVDALQRATEQGSAFVFGYLAGGPLPFTESAIGTSYILALRAFPLVLTISALAALLLYWGVLQRLVGALTWLLRRTFGIGGALGIGAVVHVFVGMVEAPLLIRPWLRTMGRGELFALMSCGMAGIAGTVMVIYTSLLASVVPEAFNNILVASVIGTPAALAIAAIMVPFRPHAGEVAELVVEHPAAGALDAIVRGTSDGVAVLVSLIALLIVSIAFVALLNEMLSLLPSIMGAPLTLQRLIGWLFWPLLGAIGIPVADLPTAATLMGTKTALNEFVAYIDLGKLPPDALSPRARLMMTYALCGFANFGSLGIMIGGMTAMAPERRADIIALAPRSLLSGTLATCMSAATIGMIL